jgi:hypothetical protein
MPVFAVTTAKGVNWDHARGMRQQSFWDEHAAFADRLVGLMCMPRSARRDDGRGHRAVWIS